MDATSAQVMPPVGIQSDTATMAWIDRDLDMCLGLCSKKKLSKTEMLIL